METILTMARALEKASKHDIIRLDMQYNTNDDGFCGRVTLGDMNTLETYFVYDIHDDGTITKVH